jgi:hypothetical protein
MKVHLIAWASALALGSTLALAEKLPVPPSSLPKEILLQGAPLKTTLSLVPPMLAGSNDDIPAAQFLHIARQPARDMIAATRTPRMQRFIGPFLLRSFWWRPRTGSDQGLLLVYRARS